MFCVIKKFFIISVYGFSLSFCCCAQEDRYHEVFPSKYVKSPYFNTILEEIETYQKSYPDNRPEDIIVSFDMDGTLVDDENRLPYNSEHLQDVNPPLHAQVKEIWEKIKEYSPGTLFQAHTVVDPETYSVLETLKTKNVQLMLTTARPGGKNNVSKTCSQLLWRKLDFFTVSNLIIRSFGPNI